MAGAGIVGLAVARDVMRRHPEAKLIVIDKRAPDLVKRNFKASRPGQLHVADFTYVPMVSGFGYTAFVIDAFAGMITG